MRKPHLPHPSNSPAPTRLSKRQELVLFVVLMLVLLALIYYGMRA